MSRQNFEGKTVGAGTGSGNLTVTTQWITGLPPTEGSNKARYIEVRIASGSIDEVYFVSLAKDVTDYCDETDGIPLSMRTCNTITLDSFGYTHLSMNKLGASSGDGHVTVLPLEDS